MLVRPQLYKLGVVLGNHLRVQCRLMPQKTTARENNQRNGKIFFLVKMFFIADFMEWWDLRLLSLIAGAGEIIMSSATSVMVAV